MAVSVPPTDADFLTADIIPAGDLAAADIAAWRAITAANPALDSPFFAPEFTLAAAKARDDVKVAAIRDRGLPLAYFPFQFEGPWQRRAGAAERVGAHLSDYCGVIAAPDVHVMPADLLRLADLNAFSFSHLSPAQAEMLEGESPEYGLKADLSGGWKAYWAARGAGEKAFVADTERSARKIAKAHGALRFTYDDRDPNALARLIAAKRAHDIKTGAADTLDAPWSRRLLDALWETRGIHCAGVASTLFAGDTWVASHFGLASARTLHYWFAVYNPEMARFSPERLLLRALLEAAAARRMRTVDFSAGDGPYKRKFATAQYELYRGAWYRPGLTALGYRVAQSLAGRLKAFSAEAGARPA
jgi:CelD/BcsL family acetyltransferase involved in cellulose biosynthesis